MLSHLEELDIAGSLQETDARSFVQSLKQLSNLRSLNLSNTEVGLEGNLDLSKGIDSTNLSYSTSSRMDSLETITIQSLHNISKLTISRKMCPRLQTLRVYYMENLKEIELKQLGRLNSLQVYNCGKLETMSDLSSLMSLQELEVTKCARLKSLSTLARLHHLEKIKIRECPKLQSVEGLDELPRLKSLMIEMPDDGCPLALHGPTRMLSLKRIVLIQEVMYNVSVKSKANLFSEVINAQAVSEIERGEYNLEMESSLNAITIYALLVTSRPNSCIDCAYRGYYFYPIPSHKNWLITVLVAENDSKCSLEYTRIEKGFKATVKVGEEGKALIVMRRIVDQLYGDVQRKGPELASYDVV